jgi:hypothetical protein
MTDEYRPPEEIWLDDEALADHFESVKDRMKNPSSGGGDWEDIPGPGEQNEFTAGLRGR